MSAGWASGSRRVAPEVLEPSGHVSQEPHEHVHRSGLHVATGLPPREGVLAEPEEARHLRLCEVEAIA